MGIGLIHIILPMEIISKKFFPVPPKVINEKPYSIAKIYFSEVVSIISFLKWKDYDRANPAIQRKAKKEFDEIVENLGN